MGFKLKDDGEQLGGDRPGLLRLVEEYKSIDDTIKQWTDRKKELRSRLEIVLDAEGYTDEKGHVWLDLPESVGGTTRLQRQKRVGQTMNEETAEVLLKRLGLWDKCSMEITVVDEDAVLALGFQGAIPDEVMSEIFEEKVSYAFYLR